MTWDGWLHIHVPAMFILVWHTTIAFLAGLSYADDIRWGLVWWLLVGISVGATGALVYWALVQSAVVP